MGARKNIHQSQTKKEYLPLTNDENERKKETYVNKEKKNNMLETYMFKEEEENRENLKTNKENIQKSKFEISGLKKTPEKLPLNLKNPKKCTPTGEKKVGK